MLVKNDFVERVMKERQGMTIMLKDRSISFLNNSLEYSNETISLFHDTILKINQYYMRWDWPSPSEYNMIMEYFLKEKEKLDNFYK